MSNDKFEWTDSKVLDFIGYSGLDWGNSNVRPLFEKQLEQFKKEQLSKRDWVVFTESGYGFRTWFAFEWTNKFDAHDEYGGVKVFETKFDADEWIALNKPQFSFRDIMAMTHHIQKSTYGIDLQELKQLAKSKMDGKK